MPDPLRILVRAPVRIDFAGGWTDVPRYANARGGVVTNAAVAHYVHVECRTGGGVIRLHAEDLGDHVTVHHPAGLAYDGTLDLHKAALNMFPVTGGVELLSRAEVPAGSGLGGSGALDVALIAALAAARQEEYDAAELAELAFQLEATELGLEGGRQDQLAAAYGGCHEWAFGGDGAVERRPVELSADARADLERCLVLAYTGQSHFSSQTHERVWEAYGDGRPEVVEALAALGELGHEAAAALRRGNWPDLARAVDANWAAQQRLDATISTPRVRGVEAAMREAGVWGLKATGAGAGGCLVGLADPARVPDVRAAAVSAGAEILDVRLDTAGVSVAVEVLDEGPRA